MKRMSPKRKGKVPGSVWYDDKRHTWRAQVTLRTGRVSDTFPSEGTAWDWLKDINDRRRTGLSASGVRMTFGECIKAYMDNVAANRAASTHRLYQRQIQTHILPAWERVKLVDLDPLEIETWLNGLGRQGVGGRTRELIHAIMHAVLEWAVEKRRLGYNPMNGVEKPRYQRRKAKPLTQTQVRRFLEIIGDHPRRVLYTIAIATGMREGELLGLRQVDIDWDQNGIHVTGQAQYIPHQGMQRLDHGKTEDSAAFIRLGLRSMVLLQEQLDLVETVRQDAEQRGRPWQDLGLVFPSATGTMIEPTNLLRQFKGLLEKAGIDTSTRFHDLRHTSLSAVANDLGASVKGTQKRARHAQASTTLNVYGGDTSADLDAQIAERLDAWLLGEK